MADLRKTVFSPDEVARMAAACKAATSERADLAADEVARRILAAAADGEETTERLKNVGAGKP